VELIVDPVELIFDERSRKPTQKCDGITDRCCKQIAMSSNPLLLEQSGIASRNPKLGPGGLLAQYTREAAARKVQKYIHMRQLFCGMRAETRTNNDQTYRAFVLAYLLKIISSPRHKEKWGQLLLGAEDTEVAET
jgi:hypothetical protein